MDKIDTPSLDFCSVMIAYGSNLEQTDKSNPRRVIFTLVDPPMRVWLEDVRGDPEPLFSGTFDRLFNYFNTGRMMFPSNSFVSMKRLKSIIYAD